MTQRRDLLAAGALIVAAAMGGNELGCAERASSVETTRPRGAAPPPSNVRHTDYVGSATCIGCHRDVGDRWLASPMRRMTRTTQTATVQAPFDGRRFDFMSDSATAETHAGERFVRVESREQGTSLWRVTKVIGGRHREDFAGVRVSGVGAGATESGEEHVLPISWLLFEDRYRYKGYSVMSPERPGLRRGSKWRTTCLFCHNTVSTLSASFDELYGQGAPVYQGSASFELPASRRPRFELRDAGALSAALELEMSRLEIQLDAAGPRGLLAQAIKGTRRRYAETHLVELGIGCEACHGGGRAHAEAPTQYRTSFDFHSDFAHVTAADGRPTTRAEQENRACARCHTVLFTRYPYTWEGRRRHDNPGGSPVNSGEARDFMLGGCARELACSSCHDPHARDTKESVARAYSEAGNPLCTRCHTSLASDEKARAHSHHAAGSAGNACLACHMPRKNLAVDYSLTAYHRIGSPSDSERVLGDRPLECALCHADKSTAQLVASLERWTGRRYDRRRLRELYGDLEVSPVLATLKRGKPHEQAVAASVAGSTRLDSSLPWMLAQLDNPFPLVRLFSRDAIERAVGEKMDVDDHLPGAEFKRQAAAWAEARGHLPVGTVIPTAKFE